MNRKAIKKELEKTKQKEKKFIYRCVSNEGSVLQEKVNGIIPKKIKSKLDGAFRKAFSLIFSKGKKIIKKTYSEEKMQERYDEDRRFAKAAGTGLSIRSFEGTSRRRGMLDGLIIAGIGAGLGFLGRGIISIPMFVSCTFRNIFETAECYGFDSNDPEEQFLMMVMMEAALSTGEDAEEADDVTEEVIDMIDNSGLLISDELIEEQIEKVAGVLSDQILYLKALQIIPILGGIIGLTDVHFYNKVHKYIDLKYRKRFLLRQGALE